MRMNDNIAEGSGVRFNATSGYNRRAITLNRQWLDVITMVLNVLGPAPKLKGLAWLRSTPLPSQTAVFRFQVYE